MWPKNAIELSLDRATGCPVDGPPDGLLGWDLETLRSGPLPQRAHADDAEPLRAALASPPAALTFRTRAREGDWRWLLARVAPGDSEDRLRVRLWDVTEKKRSERSLRDRPSWFGAVMGHLQDLIVVLTPRPDGRFEMAFVGGQAEAILGVPSDALYLLDDSDFIHPDDLQRSREAIQRCAEAPGSSARMEIRVRHSGGAWRVLEHRIVNALEDPALGAMIFTIRDRTEERDRERRLRERADWFRAVTAHSTDTLQVLSTDGAAGVFSSGLEHLLGGFSFPLRDSELFQQIHPDDQEQVRQGFVRTWLEPSHQTTVAFRARLADGRWRYLESKLVNRLADPIIRGVIITSRDVTDRELFDALTGLPNRRLFLDRLAQLQRREAPREPPPTVLAISLDRLSQIADAMGAAAGARMLEVAVERMRVDLRPEDTIARIGEAELALLLRARTPHMVAHLCERLRRALEAPFPLADQFVTSPVTIGAAAGSWRDADPETALRCAEVSLRRGLQRGGGRTETFDPRMGSRALRRLELESALRRALDSDALHLHYQPIVEIHNGRIVGAEALCRWDGEDGPVSPGVFIPLAEEIGVIHRLGVWVLETACREAAAWPGDAAAPFITVNLSGRQLDRKGLLDEIQRVLEKTGLPPSRLKLEVTETALISDPGAAARALRAIRQLGVKLALDDFGTGYSSLAYLHTFPFDTLKIDHTFTALLEADKASAAIVPTVIALAWNLGMDLVAEGVETPRQLEILQELGCPLAQGFFFARPAPAEQVREMILQDRGRHAWPAA